MANNDLPEHSDFSPETEVSRESDKRRRTYRTRMSPLIAIVSACFDASTTPAIRRRLKQARSIAVVVRVPSPAWVAPLSILIDSRYGSNWLTYFRDGSQREHSATVGCETVIDAYNRAMPVIGVAADLRILPQVLTAAPDITILVKTPQGADIVTAIGRFMGRLRRVTISDQTVAGLDLMDLTASFRIGSSPSQIVERLRAISEASRGVIANDKVPDLANAVEYGKAREWGLALANDIADYRAGRLPWAAVDRGAILHSEPGMGKSLYARMLCQACGVPLVVSSVADWFMVGGGYLNDMIRTSRAVFARAARLAPCILFLDEIDAIPNRTTLSERNRDYWTPLVNDILVNLDNAVGGQREGVVVLGATNNIKAIDPALIRPGRLERAIEIERPKLEGVRNILRHHLDRELMSADLSETAALLEHTTGAEIMQVVRHARRLARQAGRDISMSDLLNAALPPLEVGPDIMWRVCVHEAGHVVAALALPYGSVRRCVIGVKGTAAAYTLFDQPSDESLTVAAVEARSIVLLSGRAAELAILGSASTGAGGNKRSDLAKATELIALLHASAGLGNTLAYLSSRKATLDAVRVDYRLRREVERHLSKLQRRANDMISAHRPAIVDIANALRTRRHLPGDELSKLFAATITGRTRPRWVSVLTGKHWF